MARKKFMTLIFIDVARAACAFEHLTEQHMPHVAASTYLAPWGGADPTHPSALCAMACGSSSAQRSRTSIQ
eukprot:1158269-Pelagomonas_calceolata.AAC.22